MNFKVKGQEWLCRSRSQTGFDTKGKVVGCSQPHCNQCTSSSAIFYFEKEFIRFLPNVGSYVPLDMVLIFRKA